MAVQLELNIQGTAQYPVEESFFFDCFTAAFDADENYTQTADGWERLNTVSCQIDPAYPAHSMTDTKANYGGKASQTRILTETNDPTEGKKHIELKLTDTNKADLENMHISLKVPQNAQKIDLQGLKQDSFFNPVQLDENLTLI